MYYTNIEIALFLNIDGICTSKVSNETDRDTLVQFRVLRNLGSMPPMEPPCALVYSSVHADQETRHAIHIEIIIGIIGRYSVRTESFEVQ